LEIQRQIDGEENLGKINELTRYAREKLERLKKGIEGKVREIDKM
jgi:hypothetical protein